MSYKEALEAAGAEVLAYEFFGSYQGDWYAVVKFNGNVGVIKGSYGSCTVCDAFQAEFGYDGDETYNYETGEYEKNPDYPAKLAAFGANYLEDLMTFQAALNEAARNLDWDHDAEEMVNWVKARAAEHNVLVIAPVKKED